MWVYNKLDKMRATPEGANIMEVNKMTKERWIHTLYSGKVETATITFDGLEYRVDSADEPGLFNTYKSYTWAKKSLERYGFELADTEIILGGNDDEETVTEKNYTMIKKDLQKAVSGVRADRKKLNNREEFPKAMMTGQQMDKNTATVNCGGEWRRAETTLEIATQVMNDKRFKDFLEKHNADARIEANNFGGFQIRINY